MLPGMVGMPRTLTTPMRRRHAAGSDPAIEAVGHYIEQERRRRLDREVERIVISREPNHRRRERLSMRTSYGMVEASG